MTEDRRVVISSEPHLTPEEVSRRTFASVFRGFDPTEVRAYLRRVSDELGVARERQRHLEHLLADAQNRSAVPPPPLDEATLTAALGEETARVLQTARQAAADIKAKAQENVERLLRQAHEDAARIREESEGIFAVKEAEAVAAAEATHAAARAEAEAVVEAAREQARAMLEEAKEVRAKVLGEVVRRRNVARVQVAQLRAGRDRLLDAYRVVRDTLDGVTDELGRAEEEARASAEAAGKKMATELAADAADGEGDAEMPSLDPELLGEPAPIDLGVDVPEPALAAPEVVALPPAPDAEAEQQAEAAPEPAPEPEAEAEPDSSEPEIPAVLALVEPPSEIEAVRIIVPVEPDAPADEAVPEPAAETAEAESEPAPDAVDAAEPEAGDPEPDAGPVDDLFARIRAGRADAVAKAQQVLADTSSTDPVNGSSPSGSNGAAPTVTEEDPADDLLAQRDSELEPLQSQLAKRLKRAMQDEQNDVLDGLRVHKGRPALTDVLPAAAAQGARYRDVALPLLEQAAKAGAASSGDAEADVDLGSVVGDLADAITGPLRSRLDDTFAAAAREDDDTNALTERVGAAYREWKMQRIEGLAADHLFAAHALGGFAAVAPGTAMRWVVHDVDGPCPDCDDNALAGATPRGESFPTGQTHPPAHAGCHCLLVISPS